MEYTMWMPNNLPAREFNLKVVLYFAMGEDMLASLFFNEVRPGGGRERRRAGRCEPVPRWQWPLQGALLGRRPGH